MAKSQAYRSKVLASLESFQAIQDTALRNCLVTIEQTYATAAAVEADQLPDDPSYELRAAFAKIDEAMRVVAHRIAAKLDEADV